MGQRRPQSMSSRPARSEKLLAAPRVAFTGCHQLPASNWLGRVPPAESGRTGHVPDGDRTRRGLRHLLGHRRHRRRGARGRRGHRAQCRRARHQRRRGPPRRRERGRLQRQLRGRARAGRLPGAVRAAPRTVHGELPLHRHPQRQAARLLPFHLHRSGRRDPDHRDDAVRVRRRQALFPVLRRARPQGRLRDRAHRGSRRRRHLQLPGRRDRSRWATSGASGSPRP